MADLPNNFANRNLRNTSFRGQALHGVDFRNADLRGCDFRWAQLQGAQLEGARIGMAPEPLLLGILLALLPGALSFHAISRLVFSVLGTPIGDPYYSYMLALMLLLGFAGGSLSLVGRGRLDPVARFLLVVVCGAVLGFFYGGMGVDNKLQVALIAAVVSAVLVGILQLRYRAPFLQVVWLAIGGPATYGFAFLAWVQGLALVSGYQWWGILLWGLGILYLGLTLRCLVLIVEGIRIRAMTAFEGADLRGTIYATPDPKILRIRQG